MKILAIIIAQHAPLPCKKEKQSHPQHLPWAGTQAPAFPSPLL